MSTPVMAARPRYHTNKGGRLVFHPQTFLYYMGGKILRSPILLPALLRLQPAHSGATVSSHSSFKAPRPLVLEKNHLMGEVWK